jgi:uncharacterized membrane protein YgdD (TMEM256/DUF423 family)
MTFAWLGALNAFFAVAAGAFGAHGLKSRVSADMLAVFETGARYHMYHALALFAVAWLATRGGASASALRLATYGGWSFQLGIVLFSGSLYALALSGVRSLGMVTPLGGLAFLAGWILVALSASR